MLFWKSKAIMMLPPWTPNRKPENWKHLRMWADVFDVGASDPGEGFCPSMPGGEVMQLDTVLQSS